MPVYCHYIMRENQYLYIVKKYSYNSKIPDSKRGAIFGWYHGELEAVCMHIGSSVLLTCLLRATGILKKKFPTSNKLSKA